MEEEKQKEIENEQNRLREDAKKQAKKVNNLMNWSTNEFKHL